MRINPSSTQLQQADLVGRTREAGVQQTPAGGSPAAPVTQVAKVDRVEISDAGRALAAQQGGEESVRGEMSPERLSELRQKVLGGAYNSLEVVDQIARRMLQAGDI